MTERQPSEGAMRAAIQAMDQWHWLFAKQSEKDAAELANIIDREAVAPAVRETYELMKQLLGLVELHYGSTDPLASNTVLECREWYDRYRHLLKEPVE